MQTQVATASAEPELLSKPTALSLSAAPILGEAVEVASQAIVEAASRGIKVAEELVVDSQEAYIKGTEHFNNLAKFSKSIKNKALEAGRPYRDYSDQIMDEAKDKLLNPLSGASTSLELKLMKYKKDQDAERARVIAEQHERQRKELEAQRAAQAEKQRIENEAKAKEEMAAKRMEKAQTPTQLNNAIAAGEAAQALREEAEAVPVPFVEALPVLAAPAELKGKGVKMKLTPVIDGYDLALLPVTYHELNESKAKKHILDGTITVNTPGIKFHIEEGLSGTGR